MKIEIAEHGRMSESGSSLLRLIQNQDMPLLDLLVRESVQNSLDAAAKGKAFVNVDISIKNFISKDLNKHLERITDRLDKRFPTANGPYKCIVVRDSNTVGLSGPVKYEDVKGQDFGNCLKLIYEICKPQTDEGAGGSWGLGKTIYFRLGIGLVFYYSRINENGKFRSRLAACLVEDERKSDSLIPASSGVKRGIAWWGDTAGWRSNTTVPVENEHEISRVLSVFGVSPYQGAETGTTVIIPYINEEMLLQEVYARNEDSESRPYWATDIPAYLKVALQRWYAPRILNTQFAGAYLNPSVNGEKIKIAKLLTLFKTVRELYIYATTGCLPEDSLIADSSAHCKVDDIRVREVFVPGTSSAGKFAYIKLNQEQLKMQAPDNEKSPYQQITNRAVSMDNGNIPIVMFTRKPGMIVGYDFEGAWTHRMPHSSETEYIIGLFVANSENRMKDILSLEGKNLSLEEYIRQGEKADHASWTDRNIAGTNPRVISKVQNGVINTIAKNYKEKTPDVVERTNLGLSHALANILLPSAGFGKSASGSGGGGTGSSGSGTGKKRSVITLRTQPYFSGNEVSLDFELNMAKKSTVISLLVVTDYKKIGAEEWESADSIGREFPLSISKLSFSERKGKVKNSRWSGLGIQFEESGADSDISVTFDESSSFGTISSVIVECAEACYLRGTVVFRSAEKGIKGTVDVREGKK